MSKQTTLEAPVYVAERDLEDLGRTGGSSVNVYIHGYWSDVISVYLSRECKYDYTVGAETEVIWTTKVSHSSGGRDTDEVADDVRAEELFAHGMLAACHYARTLRLAHNQAALEKAYQARQERRREAEEAEKVAKAAAVAADVMVGDTTAAQHITEMITEVHTKTVGIRPYRIAVRRFFRLGDLQRSTSFEARMGRDHVVRFFQDGAVISRARVINEMAVCSSRPYTVEI